MTYSPMAERFNSLDHLSVSQTKYMRLLRKHFLKIMTCFCVTYNFESRNLLIRKTFHVSNGTTIFISPKENKRLLRGRPPWGKSNFSQVFLINYLSLTSIPDHFPFPSRFNRFSLVPRGRFHPLRFSSVR